MIAAQLRRPLPAWPLRRPGGLAWRLVPQRRPRLPTSGALRAAAPGWGRVLAVAQPGFNFTTAASPSEGSGTREHRGQSAPLMDPPELSYFLSSLPPRPLAEPPLPLEKDLSVGEKQFVKDMVELLVHGLDTAQLDAALRIFGKQAKRSQRNQAILNRVKRVTKDRTEEFLPVFEKFFTVSLDGQGDVSAEPARPPARLSREASVSDPDVVELAEMLLRIRAASPHMMGQYMKSKEHLKLNQVFHNLQATVDLQGPADSSLCDDIVEEAFLDPRKVLQAQQLCCELKQHLPLTTFAKLEKEVRLMSDLIGTKRAPWRSTTRRTFADKSRSHFQRIPRALGHHWVHYGPGLYEFLQVYDPSASAACPFAQLWSEWLGATSSRLDAALRVLRSQYLTQAVKDSIVEPMSDVDRIYEVQQPAGPSTSETQEENFFYRQARHRTRLRVTLTAISKSSDDGGRESVMPSARSQVDALAEELQLLPRLGQANRSLFVRNLPKDATREHVRKAFERCGDINAVQVFNASAEEQDVEPAATGKKGRKKKKKKKRKAHLTTASQIRPTDTYAWVQFKDDRGWKRASTSSMSIFGVLIDKRLCRTVPAEGVTVLHMHFSRGVHSTRDIQDWLNESLTPLELDVRLRSRASSLSREIMPTSVRIFFPTHELTVCAYTLLAAAARDQGQLYNWASPDQACVSDAAAMTVQWFPVSREFLETIFGADTRETRLDNDEEPETKGRPLAVVNAIMEKAGVDLALATNDAATAPQ